MSLAQALTIDRFRCRIQTRRVRATKAVTASCVVFVVGGLGAAVSTDASSGATAPPKTLSKLCGLPYVNGAVVRFSAGDGAQLVGAVAGKGRVGVLFANTTNGGICDWVANERDTINAIVAAGAQVLLFDYRGTGFSPKHAGAATRAWDRDVIAGAAQLRRHGARQVVLAGASAGGIAVLAAAGNVKPAPAGVIGLSASGRIGPTSGGVDGRAAAAALRVPLLFIVAKGDPYGFSPTMTLFRAARSTDKQLLVVPGSSHGFFDSDASGAKVRTRILGFIKAHTRS
jgi:pimeloyl-ACP methyl ester carboxylesterase